MTPYDEAKAKYTRRLTAMRRWRTKYQALWPSVRPFAPFTLQIRNPRGVEIDYCIGVTDTRHVPWDIKIGEPTGPDLHFNDNPPPPPNHALKLCRSFVMWHSHWFFGLLGLAELGEEVWHAAAEAALADCLSIK